MAAAGRDVLGRIGRKSRQTEIAAGTWALAFSIETLARDATVVLPLVREEATWQPTAMLDGVPVPLDCARTAASVQSKSPSLVAIR